MVDTLILTEWISNALPRPLRKSNGEVITGWLLLILATIAINEPLLGSEGSVVSLPSTIDKLKAVTEFVV
jgi:hypothetical protein